MALAKRVLCKRESLFLEWIHSCYLIWRTFPPSIARGAVHVERLSEGAINEETVHAGGGVFGGVFGGRLVWYRVCGRRRATVQCRDATRQIRLVRERVHDQCRDCPAQGDHRS